MFDPTVFLTVMARTLIALPMTLLLAFVPFSLGTVLGLALALSRHNRVPLLGHMAAIWVAVIRGTPVIVLIFLVYFIYLDGLTSVIEMFSLPFSTANVPVALVVVAALSAMVSAFACDAWRSALMAVTQGQYDAASALGLNRAKLLRLVVMPQMLPVALPQLGNILVGTLKATSLAYLVSVTDIMAAAIGAASGALRFTEAYASVALIYWVLTALATHFIQRLERQVAIPNRSSSHARL
ncbi:amino acid ABC transporter permease [Mesorhizobium sp. DCY119]|uniref:amino acid ABC transporter permease n=1 Tax=Mesorhizobium sp. DCY119 TaxID=2108445 RepID=UPI000E75304B|nr:amino acid ABC transporter permease [Mesorhizobium sp. DCY119]RJG40578.1 amino acid ABC transporter permease [Mesorhizobium sp. DCY119]